MPIRRGPKWQLIIGIVTDSTDWLCAERYRSYCGRVYVSQKLVTDVITDGKKKGETEENTTTTKLTLWQKWQTKQTTTEKTKQNKTLLKKDCD